MKETLMRAVLLFALLAAVTGVAYPLAVTLIAGAAFPFQAHGSLIIGDDGEVIGSVLSSAGTSPRRSTQGRPSSTPLAPYNARTQAAQTWGRRTPSSLSRLQSGCRRSGSRCGRPGSCRPGHGVGERA